MMGKYEFLWLIFTFHDENYWKKTRLHLMDINDDHVK